MLLTFCLTAPITHYFPEWLRMSSYLAPGSLAWTSDPTVLLGHKGHPLPGVPCPSPLSCLHSELLRDPCFAMVQILRQVLPADILTLFS